MSWARWHWRMFLICLSLGEIVHAKVIPFPAIDGLHTSDIFAVKIDRQIVWVEKLIPDLDKQSIPNWFWEPHTANQEVHIANFACSGRIHVSIAVKEPIWKVQIHPKSRGIKTIVEENSLRFTLSGPDKLYIEINKLPELFLFANPIEQQFVQPGDPHVLYFGPGVHQPGIIHLRDQSILYIEAGAIVYGRLRGNPKNATVMGYGILDGKYQSRLVHLEQASHLRVQGVMLRNGRSWHNRIQGRKSQSQRQYCLCVCESPLRSLRFFRSLKCWRTRVCPFG